MLYTKAFQTLLFRCQPNSRHVSYHNLEVTDKDGIRVVSINRPDKRNCVNKQTAHELFTAFEDFNTDETVHVAVLCGKGETFCAGYDLKELAESVTPVKSILSQDFGIGSAPMVGGICVCHGIYYTMCRAHQGCCFKNQP